MNYSDYPEIMVYGLYDPDTDELRYIGKTCCGGTRIRAHMSPTYAKDESYKSRWLRTLFAAGKLPVPRILLVCETDQQALDEEVRLIKEARDRGERLTNITDGGEGFKGLVVTPESAAKTGASLRKRWLALSDADKEFELERIHKNLHTKETWDKISKSMTGKKQTRTPKLLASYAARRGKTVSPETRAKLSAAKTGKKLGPMSEKGKAIRSAAWTPEKRKARSEAYTGRKLPQETCDKISAANKGRIVSAEVREHMSAAQRGIPRPYASNPSDETRAKLSKASKGRKVSPETIAKRVASLRVYNDTHPRRVHSAEERAKRSASLKIAWARRKAEEDAFAAEAFAAYIESSVDEPGETAAVV